MLDTVSPAPTTRAPAKINLTLHVLGRRADGYHVLESLVAFAGCGDTLSLEPGGELALWVEGPTAARVGDPAGNLVLKAARLLAERVDGLRLGRFHLIKRLPVAAGIGGGSADAAAALRLLTRHNGLPLRNPAVAEAARLTGADVPVCLEPRSRMMRGIGDEVGPPLDLPRLFTVLVNSGVAVETPAVFRELGLEPGKTLAEPGHPGIGPGDDLLGFLRAARNDLEAPAMRLQPVIREALDRLCATPGCRLARMSGSGGTVFGLFEDCREAAAAAKHLRRAKPDWWVKATSLR